MKTVLITADNEASAKLLLRLAKRMGFKAKLLNKNKPEDRNFIAQTSARQPDITLDEIVSEVKAVRKARYARRKK